jgi:hypothetical protein
MTRIAKYISYTEATKSQTATRLGISNRPGGWHLANMQYVGRFFDQMREHFGVPIYISSFFRSPELNRAIGGSPTSFHQVGAAIDCDADILGGISNRDIFNYFYESDLPFSELIWEFGDENNPAWVHIAALKGDDRRMIKRAIRTNGRSKIIQFEPSV